MVARFTLDSDDELFLSFPLFYSGEMDKIRTTSMFYEREALPKRILFDIANPAKPGKPIKDRQG